MSDQSLETISNDIKAIRCLLFSDLEMGPHADDRIGIDLRAKWIEERLGKIEKSLNLISWLIFILVCLSFLSLFIK